jgi:uncharacterized membrane protein
LLNALRIPRIGTYPIGHEEDGRIARWLMILLFSISVLIACFTHNTYDSGDSIMHYQFSRYAFSNPENFLDSWAKPLFVLITALPAQLGFVGIKLFNCTVVALAGWFAYRLAAGLELRWPWLALLFTYAAPDFFRIQFSGLTEPLFSLFLVAGAAFTVRNQPVAGAIMMSFLPFIRSEGFLLQGLWGVYFVLTRQWQALPWLGFGFVLYGIVGVAVFGDFFWIFTHNAYPFRAEHYGSGSLSYYARHLPDILGWVLTALFAFGLVAGLLDWLGLLVSNRSTAVRWAERALVYGSSCIYLGAHSLFWSLGIFGSFGMIRVMNAVVPLMIIIALQGLFLLARLISTQLTVQVLSLLVVVFPLTGMRKGFNWRTDFSPIPEQALADQLAAQVLPHYAESKPLVYWEHPYMGVAMQVNPFDQNQHRPLKKILDEPVPKGALVLWDNWFAVTESGIPLEKLTQDSHYQLLVEGKLPRDARRPEKGLHHQAIFVRK